MIFKRLEAFGLIFLIYLHYFIYFKLEYEKKKMGTLLNAV